MTDNPNPAAMLAQESAQTAAQKARLAKISFLAWDGAVNRENGSGGSGLQQLAEAIEYLAQAVESLAIRAATDTPS